MVRRRKYYSSKGYRHLRKKKSIFRNRFFWFFILGIMILAGLFYLFVFSPVFQIRAITIQGTHFIDASKVKEEAERITERKILFFPTKSVFVFNKKEAKGLILEKFFPAEDVVIRKRLFHRLLIEIQEREVRAACCAVFSLGPGEGEGEEEATSTEEIIAEEECYFLDKDGLAFQPAQKDELPQDIALIRSENKITLKDKVIEKEFLDFVISVNDKLKEEGIAIKEFKVSPSKIEAEVAESGLMLYFSPQKSPEIQIEDLLLLLEDESLPEKEADLDYIDLRFDKIFCK